MSFPRHHANARDEVRAKQLGPVKPETLADRILLINADHTPGPVRLSEEAWRQIVDLARAEKTKGE